MSTKQNSATLALIETKKNTVLAGKRTFQSEMKQIARSINPYQWPFLFLINYITTVQLRDK